MKQMSMYLAGGMSGLSFEDQIKWRNQIRDAILYGGYDYDMPIYVFNPLNFYNLEDNHHKTEKEAMDFDLNRLRNSDLVVVNFNAPKSIGTAMELAVAYENRIPVVGLNENNIDLHPWLIECCTRVCDDMYELVEHVVEFYLK